MLEGVGWVGAGRFLTLHQDCVCERLRMVLQGLSQQVGQAGLTTAWRASDEKAPRAGAARFLQSCSACTELLKRTLPYWAHSHGTGFWDSACLRQGSAQAESAVTRRASGTEACLRQTCSACTILHHWQLCSMPCRMHSRQTHPEYITPAHAQSMHIQEASTTGLNKLGVCYTSVVHRCTASRGKLSGCAPAGEGQHWH